MLSANLQQPRKVGAVEWHGAIYHCEEDDATRPCFRHVGLVISAHQDLRSSETKNSTEGVQHLIPVLDVPGVREIAELQDMVASDQAVVSTQFP